MWGLPSAFANSGRGKTGNAPPPSAGIPRSEAAAPPPAAPPRQSPRLPAQAPGGGESRDVWLRGAQVSTVLQYLNG